MYVHYSSLLGCEYFSTLLYSIGSASPPTNLSMEYSSSFAVVSFQPPVYGAECVDHYIVTAASEERNVTCSPSTDQFIRNCSLPGTNVNDYNFTVYGVTNGVNGVTYNGSVAYDCCKLNYKLVSTI